MIAEPARRALQAAHGDRLECDVPLARYTSLRVGGPADVVVTPESIEEVVACVAVCATHGVPLTVLGGGFNSLVLDGGIEGVVLRTQRLRRLECDDAGRVLAEAGVSHSQIARLCATRGFSGLEFGAGVPGSMGGWVAMNAGVPGAEVKDVLLEVEVVVAESGEATRRWLSRDELRFVYRGARGLPAGSVVVAARFQLERRESTCVREAIDGHLAHRRRTQPLDVPSCGSVFKNPPGDHAGRLIEQVGLKGAREGGARITAVHANFIANEGGATAADVLALVRRAQTVVREQAGVELEPEVRILGRSR